MSSPDFWNSREKAEETVKKVSLLKNTVEPYDRLEKEIRDNIELLLLLGEDASSSGNEIAEIEKEFGKIEEELAKLEFRTLMNEPEDLNNAIVSMNAGAGGTESCDWTSMLLRMYKMWAESKGFSLQMIDILPGEEAGTKNTTFVIKGNYAFGYLKSERGVHRLVRISPFDSNKRRHTSFSSVDVIPEVSEDIDIEINEADLRIDTYRSGGAGGQHVNVTDSAVRITHIPTGLVSQCQSERSQHKNKAAAMRVLKSRMYDLEREKREKERMQKYGQKEDIGWGSQIRSYVFQPYTMVKDHRTEYKTSNVSAVMDGKIDDFIEAYLKWLAVERAGAGKKTESRRQKEDEEIDI
jgi:peptide chain release factor 2